MNSDKIEIEFGTAIHAECLHAIFNTKSMRKHSPIVDVSVSDLKERLALSGQSFSEKAPFYRLFFKINGDVVGTLIVKTIDWENTTAEIGFGLLEEHQGRGLGKKMVSYMIDKIFQESNFTILWGTVSKTNIACQNILEDLGFSLDPSKRISYMIGGQKVPQIVYTLTRNAT